MNYECRIREVLIYELLAICFYQVAGMSECCFYFVIGSGSFGGIGKIVMKLLSCRGEIRALFFGVITNRDDKIKGDFRVFIHMIGSVA